MNKYAQVIELDERTWCTLRDGGVHHHAALSWIHEQRPRRFSGEPDTHPSVSLSDDGLHASDAGDGGDAGGA